MKKSILILFALLLSLQNLYSQSIVYKFDMKEMVAPSLWRTTQKALKDAKEKKADLIIIDMNTYGGLVESADSIRTAILNLKIPTICFINNNAASAGALIAISCDSIYMRPGASFGAATVVNQTGQAMPDKYQSYMRSTMRSTAEAHGKKAIVKGTDTTWIWKRNPKIAEAMVDERIYVKGISDSGKVLTLTPQEAIKNGYCEGEAESVSEILSKIGIENYRIIEYRPSNLDKLINLLMNPFLHSILIMVIIGGIYFELQTPGVGFPLAAAVIAAILYFAPLYLEGIAANWEILIFILGLILLALEIFVIPGFGVAGISGIILSITGLAMAMVENVDFEFSTTYFTPVFKAFAIVLGSGLIAFLFILFSLDRLFDAPFFQFISLKKTQDIDEGYSSFDLDKQFLAGKQGKAITVLRPSGRVEVDGEIYDAKSEFSFIEKGKEIIVTHFENGQLYVKEKER